MNGEEFLNKLYKDLNLSEEVLHTAKGSKDKNEAVSRYMERLHSTHDKAIKRNRIDLLKELYYKKYIIKKEDIPEFMDKELIIKTQKESLSKWLNYLLDKSTIYPMWAKYWAFQGMLRIGTYNETTGTYQKRSKKTLAPFIEVNPEVLARCISMVVEYVEKKKLIDDDLSKLIESGNFQKLYTMFLEKSKKITLNKSDKNDGIWITYHKETYKEADEKLKRNIEPEYLKLYNSLQGYNTGWCTAGSKETAKNQVCYIENDDFDDEYEYDGGDFHVYYTKDKNNEYKVPRIAIRMEGNYIGEIRGIEESQNLEEGLEFIIEKKLNTIKNIDSKTIKGQLEKIDAMKRLTLLNQKSNRHEEFTKEDVIFIYELEKEIKGFGYEKDKRIEAIIARQNKEKDVSKLTEEKYIRNFWITNFKDAPNEWKDNKNFTLEAVKKKSENLRYISEEFKESKDFVSEIIETDPFLLEYAPNEWKKNKEIILLAFAKHPYCMKFASKEAMEQIIEDRQALEILKNESNTISIISLVSEELRNDKEFILKVLKKCLNISPIDYSYISEELKRDKKFILELLQQTHNYRCLRYMAEELKKDREFILELLRQTHNYICLEYISEELKNNREFVLEAVKIDGYSLTVFPEKFSEDKQISLEAIKNCIDVMEVLSEKLKNDKEFILEAIRINEDAKYYISNELKENEEFMNIISELLNKNNHNR